jgi:Tfp pilus assembly protein PilO
MIIKILLFPAVLLLVLYFIIAQVVPTAQDISRTKKEITKEEQKLQQAQEDVARAEAFKTEVASHPQEQSFITKFIPNNQKEEILLSDVSQLATQNNINLFSMGFSQGRKATNGDSTSNESYLIEGKMIVSGTYEDMKQFMHQMFRIKRLYAFKTFDLTKIEQDAPEDGEPVPTLLLSGVVSFAYGYMPGMGEVSSSAAQQSINFDLITTVMNASSDTKPLVTETKYRINPFLP